MGKLTISMAIFNSYVSLPEGNEHAHLGKLELDRFRFQLDNMQGFGASRGVLRPVNSEDREFSDEQYVNLCKVNNKPSPI